MAKTLAVAFGVVFVLVGLLGFVSNPLVGAGALFATDALHNLVHIVLGAILLIVAYSATAQSALWLKIIGVVYFVVALLGFFVSGPVLGIITVNSADNWLHLVLAVALFCSGYYACKESGMAPAGMSGGMPPANPPRGSVQ